MSIKIGIGFSQHLDPELAAKEAAFESKTDLNNDTIDVALVFSTIHYNPKKLLPTLTKVLSETRIIGCSTAGLILSHAIHTRGIGVLTMSSDEIKFGTGAIPNITHQDMRNAGASFARNCVFNFGNHKRHGFMMFMDGSLQNTSSFIYGIQEILGNAFPIVGTGSCDSFHFSQNYQIFNENLLHNSAVGLVLGGQITMGIGTRHGLKPLGKPHIIDQASGNIIKTIDGKKAFHIYDEYFGQEAQSMRLRQMGQIATHYPLGVFLEHKQEYLIRNAVDFLSDGSIVCQGDVPVGGEVHIMIGNRDAAKQAALEATQMALSQLEGRPPRLILILESLTRLKLLGRSAFEEIKKIKEILPVHTPIFGMYGHGEIIPFQSSDKSQKTHFQNESIIVIALT